MTAIAAPHSPAGSRSERDWDEIALQAPTGGNNQDWHFVVVTDAEKRAAIADRAARSIGVTASLLKDETG